MQLGIFLQLVTVRKCIVHMYIPVRPSPPASLNETLDTRVRISALESS